MRVALIQLSAGTDSAANREQVGGWLSSLAEQPHPDLVVLPEATMHDFGRAAHDLAEVAEPLDGPFVGLLSAHARRLGSTVVAGMFERPDPGADDTRGTGAPNGSAAPPPLPWNTVAVVGPDGSLRAAYRKIHLYDSFGYAESDRLRFGDAAPTVVPLGDFTLGLMTCYDLRFPEMSRLLVDAGADLLVVPSAWVRGPRKEDHWSTLLRARAIENVCYVAAAAQCGDHYCGGSMLVDPMGVALAQAAEAATVLHGDADPARLARARTQNPSLGLRRIGTRAPTHPAQSPANDLAGERTEQPVGQGPVGAARP